MPDPAWEDPIIKEIRAVREGIAARFDYDPDAIFQHMKEREAQSGRRYVSRSPRRISPDPKHPPKEGAA